ncbi:podocalyxin-like protein 2, partial [Melanotaenia boesemani]|uniref:podocalyxin-like protein 2 n=1 Tax=Melanotaenia boesemani TaxID=1250792 RepID=UPI001C048EAE
HPESICRYLCDQRAEVESTAADMPGLLLITLTALLTSCEALKQGSSQRVIPLRPPAAPPFQDEGTVQSYFIQELVRTKRHAVSELVRAQPHLVHDMSWPEIHETSRAQAKMESANSSHLNASPSASQDAARTHAAVDESLDVEDEMERMVHLAVPQDAGAYRAHSEPTDSETELFVGPRARDASQEASGFYGMDMEDRDRGEEGGEDQERRGGEDEWERDTGEDRERREGDIKEEEDGKGEDTYGEGVRDALEVNHTTPDLDALIGYSSFFHPSSSKEPSSSSQAEEHDSGLPEHRGSPVLEMGPLERELWEAEKEDEVQSSGYGVLLSSVTTARTTSAAGDAMGTATPETDTGTDFGLLGSFTKDEIEKEEEDRELTHISVFTQNPTAPEVGVAPSRQPLQPSVEEGEQLEQDKHSLKAFGLEDKSEEVEEEEWRKMDREETKIRHVITLTTDPSPTIGFTEPELEPNLEEPRQVVCLNWSELAGRGYVILNMTQNLNCEEFRACQGVRLLKIIERVFARRMNSPEGTWVIYLSKPTHQQHQLLMNVASGHGVIATQDVLDMLGEIRKSLNKVGIQNYSAASSCQSRPSKTRSDYGKLFVVLVIIGSVCMVIITSGVIYICWQRQLPATKTMYRAEELHSVENGYHDNPTLDVTNDSQAEMREKKPSTNGLTGVGEGGGEDSSRWQVFVNQAATEEDEEEQDTHL